MSENVATYILCPVVHHIVSQCLVRRSVENHSANAALGSKCAVMGGSGPENFPLIKNY